MRSGGEESIDKILVCSDGLTAILGDDQIATVLENSEIAGAASELCNQSNDASGSDNITVVLAQFIF